MGRLFDTPPFDIKKPAHHLEKGRPNMKDFFWKLFNRKGYWTSKLNELIAEQRRLKLELDTAIRLHRERKQLRIDYEIVSVRVEKAYQQYLKAMGKV